MNANDLDRAGCTVIVDQERIAEVPDLLRRLIRDSERRATMRAGARSVARPDAAGRMAEALRGIADV